MERNTEVPTRRKVLQTALGVALAATAMRYVHRDATPDINPLDSSVVSGHFVMVDHPERKFLELAQCKPTSKPNLEKCITENIEVTPEEFNNAADGDLVIVFQGILYAVDFEGSLEAYQNTL